MTIAGGWLLIASICCSLVLPAASAEAAQFRRQRKIKEFDFDERDQGNFGKLPLDWYAIGRDPLSLDPTFEQRSLHQNLISSPGFPASNQVRFDKLHQTSGRESLYLSVKGGNSGAFVQVGAIPAIPGSDYMLSVQVRTTPLEFGHARFSTYFIDAQGRRIDDSARYSPPIVTDGRWKQLNLRLLGEFDQAAYIGMQFELLQPTAKPDEPLGEHQILYKQVHGSAWIDDVVIWQMPHVSVTSPSPVNVIRAPQEPKITIEVRDLTTRPLIADMVVYDLDRRAVASDRRQIGGKARSKWIWSAPLPAFGWYILDLNIYEQPETGPLIDAAPVARSISSLLWLGPTVALDEDDATRFGIIAEEQGAAQALLLGELLEQVDLMSITLSAWQKQSTLTILEREQAALESVIHPLLTKRHQVTLALSPLPAQLSRDLDIEADNPLLMFDRSAERWRPMLAPILLRHGQRVNRWQLGSVDRPQAFLLPNLAQRLDVIRDELALLATKPRLLAPWRLDQSRHPDLSSADEVLLDVPYSIAAANIGEHLQQWMTAPPMPVVLHLRTPRADQLSQRQRVADLILRMLNGWEAGVAELMLSSPWTRSDERKLTLVPDALLGAFSGVAHFLAGRRVIGRLSPADGVECMILDGPAGGMLVAWNRAASESAAALDMYLGPDPVAIDVWGNRTALPIKDNRHQWQLGKMPIFIEGIDPELAMFRAAFKLDDPFIESLQMPHERTLTLTNYWTRTISGYMYLTDPESWRLTPRRRFFSIASGQSTQIPVTLIFPVSEVSGHKQLQARLDFTADQQYQVKLSTPMELGLKDVQFDASLSSQPGKKPGTTDLMITALVTNRSSQTLSIQVFTNIPGYPRQQRSIPVLGPGQSIVQRFRIADTGPADAGKRIRVGLRQTRGAAVINKVLTVADANQP
jgi:hypothetical protein